MNGLLVLATGLVAMPDDTVIDVMYRLWLAAFAAVAGGTLIAVLGLRRSQTQAGAEVAARFEPTLTAVREVAAASPGGTPDWAQRDTSDASASTRAALAGRGDPFLAAVDAFRNSGRGWLLPRVHAVGRVEAPELAVPEAGAAVEAPEPATQNNTLELEADAATDFERLPELAAELREWLKDRTRVLPVIDRPDGPVRLR